MQCVSCKSLEMTIQVRNLSSVYDRDNLYSIVRCATCFLVQTSPFPDESQLSKIYENEYSYELHQLFSYEKRSRSNFLSKILVENLESIEITEFGCGEGVLLQNLYVRGFKVHGIELNANAVERGNAAIGHEAITHSTVEEHLTLSKSIHGSVIMSHCLEHLQNPVWILKQISSKMHSGNCLLLVVPNLDSGLKAWKVRHWGYWQVPVHTFHFDKEWLVNNLNSLEFEIELVTFRNVDFMGIGLFLSNLLKLRSNKINPSPFSQVLLKVASIVYSKLPASLGSDDLIVLARKI